VDTRRRSWWKTGILLTQHEVKVASHQGRDAGIGLDLTDVYLDAWMSGLQLGEQGWDERERGRLEGSYTHLPDHTGLERRELRMCPLDLGEDLLRMLDQDDSAGSESHAPAYRFEQRHSCLDLQL
jgi:hypothetical protein